jgi:hypothetical protein
MPCGACNRRAFETNAGQIQFDKANVLLPGNQEEATVSVSSSYSSRCCPAGMTFTAGYYLKKTANTTKKCHRLAVFRITMALTPSQQVLPVYDVYYKDRKQAKK